MTIRELNPDLIELRHRLHRYPEVSGQETETARRIVAFLRRQAPTRIIEQLGDTGLAAVYEYGKSPTILIRCELDALPINEGDGPAHHSVKEGVSHKCGHDGHMAIVAGVAAALSQATYERGRIVLLFQPAEEDGQGAGRVLGDSKFQEIWPDYALALHNLPGFPRGQIICRPGGFTAEVRSVVIGLQGRTSHAAEPEKGTNPALAIARILQETHALQRPVWQADFALVTPVHVDMGEEAFGVSAGEGEVRLTLRTWDDANMGRLVTAVEQVAKSAAQDHGLGLKLQWTQFFSANQNDQDLFELVREASDECGLDFLHAREPFRWGEDFGLFTQRVKGAMFGIGLGEDAPALHSPDYDFDDAIILPGVCLFRALIDRLIHSH